MEKENELSRKIREQLYARFHVKTRIGDLTDDSFKYELFDHGKIKLWQVKFAEDRNGLHIDWENAWIVEPPDWIDPPDHLDGRKR